MNNFLTFTSDRCYCDKLTVECYRKVLEDFFNYKVVYAHGSTVSEISRKYRNNIVIIRTEGHLTCSIYGAVADLWDCGDETVDRFWIAYR